MSRHDYLISSLGHAYKEDPNICINACFELLKVGTPFQRAYAAAMLDYIKTNYPENASYKNIKVEDFVLNNIETINDTTKSEADVTFAKYNIYITNPLEAV